MDDVQIFGRALTSTQIQAVMTPPIEAWRALKFGANANNPAISGDGADADQDGIKKSCRIFPRPRATDI